MTDAEIIAAENVDSAVVHPIFASIELSKYSYKAFKDTSNDMKIGYSLYSSQNVNLLEDHSVKKALNEAQA